MALIWLGNKLLKRILIRMVCEKDILCALKYYFPCVSDEECQDFCVSGLLFNESVDVPGNVSFIVGRTFSSDWGEGGDFRETKCHEQQIEEWSKI